MKNRDRAVDAWFCRAGGGRCQCFEDFFSLKMAMAASGSDTYPGVFVEKEKIRGGELLCRSLRNKGFLHRRVSKNMWTFYKNTRTCAPSRSTTFHTRRRTSIEKKTIDAFAAFSVSHPKRTPESWSRRQCFRSSPQRWGSYPTVLQSLHAQEIREETVRFNGRF